MQNFYVFFFHFISISGTKVISKQQEALYPQLGNAIEIAARVSKLVEGGMSYPDAIQHEAIKAAKENLINDDLKKKIELGTEMVNKIKLDFTNAVANG